MKCMIIAALALVAAVQAKPYGIGVGAGLGDIGLEGGIGTGLGGRGLGAGIGLGLGSLGTIGVGGGIGLGGGSYGSGRGYGNSRYVGGNSGYGRTGYGGNVLNAQHNIGHEENDFDQETHQHHSSGHNVGGVLEAGHAGDSMYGHNNYGAGGQGFGHAYNRGDYVI